MSFINDDRKKKRVKEQFSGIDVSKLDMYDVMRAQNCKTYKFQKGEMYPNIKPPISQCSSSRTFDLFSEAMIDNGCGIVNPKLLNKCGKSFSESRAHSVNSTNVGNQFFHLYGTEPEQYKSRQTTPENAKEWRQLSPYELMRLKNCKTFKVAKEESYPNIKPPVSHCDPGKTVEWLIDSINYASCGRQFDMEEDDVIDLWKQIPNKHVLSYYGTRTGNVPEPEAVQFDQTLAKSLRKVAKSRPALEINDLEPEPPLAPSSGLCGPFVLNREQLGRKVKNMPRVQEKTAPHQAFTVLHCPEPVNTEFPFEQTASIVHPTTVFGMEKSAPKPICGVRRKYKHCEFQCGIPQNQCTDYEWRKHQLNPAEHSKELELDSNQIPEPRNYDELYSNLVSCFKDYDRKDSLCDLYNACCRPPKRKGESPDQVTGGPGGPRSHGGPHVIKKVDQIIEEMADEPSTQPDIAKKEEEGKKPELEIKEPFIRETEKSKKDKPDKLKQVKEERELTSPKSPKQKKGKGKSERESLEKKKKIPKNKMSENEEPENQQPGKQQPDKQQPDKRQSDKQQTEKQQPEKQRPDKEKSGRDKSEMEKPGKEKLKNETSQHEKKGLVPTDSKFKDMSSDNYQTTSKESKVTLTPETQVPKPRKKKVPIVFKPPKKSTTSVEKDCPCNVCELMRRRNAELETPLDGQLKREEKLRQMRDNLKQICHRQYAKSRRAEYPAPQHKCDPIVCDDFFCSSPKLAGYCECLQAMEQLQKLLGPTQGTENDELIYNLEDLKSRIYCRFCDCV